MISTTRVWPDFHAHKGFCRFFYTHLVLSNGFDRKVYVFIKKWVHIQQPFLNFIKFFVHKVFFFARLCLHMCVCVCDRHRNQLLSMKSPKFGEPHSFFIRTSTLFEKATLRTEMLLTIFKRLFCFLNSTSSSPRVLIF